MLRSLLLAAGDAATTLSRRRMVAYAGIEGLTPRQRQILSALARGQQTKQIARELGISEATVKTHLSRATARLGTATRAQTVARYVSWSRGR